MHVSPEPATVVLIVGKQGTAVIKLISVPYAVPALLVAYALT